MERIFKMLEKKAPVDKYFAPYPFGAWPARLTGGRSAPQTPLILQGGYRPPINPPLQSVLLHLRAFLAPLEPPYGEAKRTALKTLIVITPKTSLNSLNTVK